MSQLQALFAPLKDRLVEVRQRDESVKVFRLYALSDKQGVMKDSSKEPYVILMEQGGAVTMSIHPQHASRLMKKGEDSGMKLLEAVCQAETAEDTSEPVIVDSTPVLTASQPAVEPKAAPAVEPAVAEAPVKAASKKDRAVAIYKTMAGKPRKEIVAAFMSQLGLSAPGASTYHQNCKSGLWS
jgi:hypothetical protein